MKITARGATDAANIVLFWPENLPDEGDAMLASDPIALVESLRDQGKLIWFLCDGDGEYTVAIFVRSLVPEDLMVHCRDEERIPVLAVRGVGYFGGMEYMFKQYPKLLTKYPAMCEQVLTPEGTYAARVYRTEVPESLYESWLAAQAGVGAKRLWDIHGVIAAGAVASVLQCFSLFSLCRGPYGFVFWQSPRHLWSARWQYLTLTGTNSWPGPGSLWRSRTRHTLFTWSEAKRAAAAGRPRE